MAKTKARAAVGDRVYVSFKTTTPRHTRRLSAADFKRGGVDHPAISCEGGEVIQVSQDAADYLIDELGEFELVDPAEVEETEVEDGEQKLEEEDNPPDES